MSAARARDYRLPRGRHGLSAAEVAANQRWRLIAATATLVAGSGVGQVTGQEIAREAGVSSSTIYRLFGSVDGVLLAAFEAAAEALTRTLADADADADGTADPAASLIAACEWAAREPHLAAMLGIGPAVAVPEVDAARKRLMARLAGACVPRAHLGGGNRESLRRLLAAALLMTLAERAAALSPPAARRFGRELATLLGCDGDGRGQGS